MPNDVYDLTIIGAGPAGMFAAFYAGLRAMKTKIIDAKQEMGGFLTSYPEKTIWDVGGVEPMRCDKLIHILENQAKTFHPTVVLGEEVQHLHRHEDNLLELTSKCGNKHLTKTVLLCVGRGITQMERLDVEGADRYELANLYYTIANLENFRNKQVLISGGGHSAVDWANELIDYGAKVTVVHRRETFNALESHIQQMRKNTTVKTPYSIHQLHGNGDMIHSVSLRNHQTNDIETVQVDAVVVNHGYSRNYGPLIDWGLQAAERGIFVDAKMGTGIPGVFGAGDFVNYPSKVQLIAGTFNDAILGVNSAMLYMNPEANPVGEVSSHSDIFKERNRVLREKQQASHS